MKDDVDLCADLITPRIAVSLIPAFTSAYSMATSTAESIDFLGGWEFRDLIIPHLKNWAVEYELHRRAKEGILPFECSLAPNSRNNHLHVELRRDGFVLTISQTHRQGQIPRECVFRNDHCMDGQIALEEFAASHTPSGKEVYAIITHGCGLDSPSFILCGIPDPEMRFWAQHVNLFEVVRDLSIVDESPVTQEIQLDYRAKVRELADNIK